MGSWRCVAVAVVLVGAVAAAAEPPFIPADNGPGFRMAITNPGLDYFRQVAMPYLEAALKGLAVPDQHGDAHTSVGSFSYELTSIKASDVVIGASSVKTTAAGIAISVSSISAKFSANWHYREDSWPHVSDGGSADLSGSGISVSVTAPVGVSSTHEPTVSAQGCKCSISSLSVDFHGGASWLYNLFSSEIAGAIKSSLTGSVCSIINSEINTNANAALATLPVQVGIDDVSEINFELISTPIMTAHQVVTSHKGEFFAKSNPTEAPFAPAAIPDPAADLPRMLYIYFSTYLPETAGWVYEKSGALNYTVHRHDLPASFPIQLTTTSVGQYVPALQTLYPNMNMSLYLVGTGVPCMKLNVLPTDANATITFNMTAQVILPNKTVVNAFTISNSITGRGFAYVEPKGTQELIKGNLTFLDDKILLVHTNIGPINVDGFQAILDLFSKAYVVPLLNKFGTAGFPIPLLDGISFVDPGVTFGTNYVIVSTDLKFTPPAERGPLV